jgi:outer membrane protein assembly factor BamB
MRCATLIILLSLPLAVRADDWPQWLGPRRDNSTSEKVAPWKEAPKVLWRVPMSKGYSAPVVAGGRVFVHASVGDKNSEEEVVAIDAASGKVIWRQPYSRGFAKGGPRATVAVAGKYVYAFGATGILSCYEAETGTKKWQVDAYKQLGASATKFGVCCSPMVIGNVVLVSVGGKGNCLAAFDTDKGELLWKGFDEPASTSSPVLMAAPAQPGKLPDVVFMTTLRLLAVNPLSGELSWEYPLVFQPAGASTTPLVIGDRIMTSTMTNGSTLLQVAVKDSKRAASQLWQNKDAMGYFSTGVAGAGDLLFVMTNELQPTPTCTLRCLDGKNGKELWAKEKIGYYHANAIRTGDDRLLILDDAGTLILAEADTKGYRELARAKVSGGSFSVPALANGRLYIRDDKEVLCLELNP